MPAAPAKFTFDLDLGHRDERNSVVTEAAMAAALSRARAEGYQQGFAEGERAAATKSERSLATAAETLASRVAALHAALDGARHQLLADAVALATATARKLAGQLLAREPVRELDALFAECLAQLDTVPHVVVHCHPDLADAIREIAELRIATSGFTGRLVVIGDPDIALGDGKIEWADGGVVRDSARLAADVDARISAYLAASSGDPGPKETAP